MTHTIDDIWISSIEHLNEYREITESNGWLKTFLGRNKIPPGFPQVGAGAKYIPVEFFVKGTLQLYERQVEFHPYRFEPDNGKKYRNLNIDFRFELPYDSIKISVYTNPKPFKGSLNIQWLKLTGTNDAFPDMLLSNGGKNISQIKKENEKLLGLLTAKISLQPEEIRM